MTDPTCEQRIAEHQESREETFATLFAAASGERMAMYDGEMIDQEDAYDRIAELPLSVEVKRVVRIDLSTGGPGDWLEATLDSDGDVTSVSYHFNDWFDHAERSVSEGSALWQAAAHYAEYVSGDA